MPAGADSYRAFVAVYLIPLLGACVSAAASDILWKPVNAAVCLLSRDSRPRVRLAAGLALRELFARGREDALVLIPETLPFLSELSQDDDPDVDGCTAALLLALEATSGEDLRSYLS